MPGRKAGQGGRAPIGIMGGTFDPVHFGHLRLADEAAEILGLECVRWIPAGQPSHRNAPIAGAADRLEMVRLAIARNPIFELDDAEIRQKTPSYTVETLERLRREFGAERAIVLLLGTDSFRNLTTWERWRDLFELAHIFVGLRPGHSLTPGGMPAALAAQWRKRPGTPEEILASPAGRVVIYATTALDISASAIRAHFAQGLSPRYLLPAAVLEYIASHGIYDRASA
jgi:nicotinate-nucleotide adenylyltransferase